MADRMPGHYNLDGSYHPAALLVAAQYVSIMPIVLGHSFSWMAAFPDRNSLTSCKCLSVTLCTIAILGLDWPIEPLLHKEWPIDHLLSILWPSASSAMCCTKHRSLIPFNGNTWCLSIALWHKGWHFLKKSYQKMFNFKNWFLCQFSSNTWFFFGGGSLNTPKIGKRKKEFTNINLRGCKTQKTWRGGFSQTKQVSKFSFL